ncbi:predicted protein [Lichtheimia corymbifera JMRC:FSU:9682]|uniref:Uncharacterized protein n=1 Tax=Lichtheimia corymbifera JMRC:FSU:9682 TaxID=1263082 RepID=A0A068S4L8_9FUNG|nr:predicted protein [Lichtheimia corymbifera JMRC:FSU:9682]
MARHTTIIFLATLLLLVYSLSNAVTALPADSAPKRYERHTNVCSCPIQASAFGECCSKASGSVDGDKCNFDNSNTMSTFQICCANNGGSSSCDTNDITVVQD